MDRDYSYSYEFDERYCYPHSDVLMNKLGIRDAEELKKAEREITSVRLANARVHKIKGKFDLQHLMDIHKYIFQDIYDWAGEIRWVNIAKGNMFCNYPFIEANAESLFRKLGQFTRNYTQTVKRAADNKRRYAPGEGSIPPVLLSGVSKGVPPLAHDFACKV